MLRFCLPLFLLIGNSCAPLKFEKTCITVSAQTLELHSKNSGGKKYPVSTSKFGEGNQKGSFKTPLGVFIIVDKIGEGAKINTVFKGRVATKSKPKGKDCITSRIVRLCGLEDKNKNTLDRCVYIHGTNREDLIGTKASYGCVRMRNADIIDYFDKISVGDIVEIKK